MSSHELFLFMNFSAHPDIYIYIYIYRERERERDEMRWVASGRSTANL